MSMQEKVIAAIVALLATAAALFGVYQRGYVNGGNAVRVERDQAELARAKADSIALYRASENNLREKQDQEAKARKVSADYEKELAAARAFRPVAGGLRLPASLCGAIASSTEAAGTVRPDGSAAGTLELPDEIRVAFERFTDGARQLSKEADGQVALARAMQAFARKNGFYGDPEQDR